MSAEDTSAEGKSAKGASAEGTSAMGVGAKGVAAERSTRPRASAPPAAWAAAEPSARPARAFTLIEVMTTLALAAVVGGIAVGLFSSLVGPITAWRSHADLRSRGALVTDWLRGELALAGGGPLPGRLAVAVDAAGALHVLDVIPPAVPLDAALPLSTCADDSDPRFNPSCPRALGTTSVIATFSTAQWPMSVRASSTSTLVVSSLSASCPSPSAAPYLALVNVDRVAVVRASSLVFEPDDNECIYAVAATTFPGTDPPSAAFVDGAALPVRWHTFKPALADSVLRASWNGEPPRRAQVSAAGVALVPLPDDDVAIAQLAAFQVRFGEDTDGDGFADVWGAPAAVPVARRAGVEVAAVLARPAVRAPARSVTLPSGTVSSSAGGRLLEPVVVRVPLGAVPR